MQSKDLLKMNMAMTMQFTLMLIEDMKDQPVTQPTARGGNHPLWVLGHLVHSDCAMIDGMVLGEPNPLVEWDGLFLPGTEPVADLGHYPAFGEVLGKAHEVRARHVALLDSLTEVDLDRASQNVPKGFEMAFGTHRGCFLMVGNHWMAHRGQVADARRVAGRKAMMVVDLD